MAMKNLIIYFFSFVLISCGSKDSSVETLVDGELNWLTLEQAQAIDNKEGKKFLIDVYTDWCGWCKVMDKKTFTDSEVKQFLSDNYYVIKFNAEQKETINFLGTDYEWMATKRKGVNKLAVKLLDGRLGYPSLVLLDENLEKINVVAGYKKPDQLMEILKTIKS